VPSQHYVRVSLRGRSDETGLDALRRDFAVTQPANRLAVARIKGRIERDLAPPRLPAKVNKLVGILKRRLTD